MMGHKETNEERVEKHKKEKELKRKETNPPIESQNNLNHK